MEVKGKHKFNTSKEQLWIYLMDVVVLAKITPGISRLEALGDDRFRSYSEMKIGPVKGTFTGKMHVVNKDEHKYFQIKMEQLSRIGNARVIVNMNIEEREGMVALAFDGEANLSGIIAMTSQRVLSGAAKLLTKEIFSALEKHIEENGSTTEPIEDI